MKNRYLPEHTDPIVSMLIANRVSVIEHDLDMFHQDQIPIAKILGAEDAQKGIPLMNQIEQPPNEQMIPVRYQQFLDTRLLPFVTYREQLASYCHEVEEELKVEPISRQKAAIERRKTNFEAIKQKTGRGNTDAWLPLLENPAINYGLLAVGIILEYRIAKEVLIFLKFDESIASTTALLSTSILVVLAHLSGIIIKRGKGEKQVMLPLAVFMIVIYFAASFLLSFYRTEFLLFNQGKAISESLFDPKVIQDSHFIGIFLIQILLGLGSALLGWLSVDSCKSFQESHMDFKAIPRLQEQLEAEILNANREHNKPNYLVLEEQRNAYKRQIAALDRVLGELKLLLLKKIRECIYVYRAANLNNRNEHGPVPICFSLDYMDPE